MIASWRDSCPIHGICTECGLELLWADILNPHRAVPPWFFEHSLGGRTAAFFVTARRTFRPFRFWRDIKLNYGVRWRRLVLFALALLLLAHLIVGAASLATARSYGAVYGALSSLVPQGSVPWLGILSPLVWPYGLLGTWGETVFGSSCWLYVAFGAFLLMPFSFLVLPTTLSRAKVRLGHLIRIGAYSLTGLPLVLLPCALTVKGSPFFIHPTYRWAFDAPLVELLFPDQGLLPLLSLLWLGVFWLAASARYLHLRHAAGVVVAMLICSFLAIVVVMSLIHPGFLTDPLVQAFSV